MMPEEISDKTLESNIVQCLLAIVAITETLFFKSGENIQYEIKKNVHFLIWYLDGSLAIWLVPLSVI